MMLAWEPNFGNHCIRDSSIDHWKENYRLLRLGLGGKGQKHGGKGQHNSAGSTPESLYQRCILPPPLGLGDLPREMTACHKVTGKGQQAGLKAIDRGHWRPGLSPLLTPGRGQCSSNHRCWAGRCHPSQGSARPPCHLHSGSRSHCSRSWCSTSSSDIGTHLPWPDVPLCC